VEIDSDEGGLTPALVADLDRADGALAAAERDLERADPGVLLRRSKPAEEVLAALQDRLDNGTVVLAYIAVGDVLIGWAVTHEDVGVSPLEYSARRLAHAVRDLHRSCAAGRASTAEELSELLLAPFVGQLATHPRVVVVPSGPLNLVPFHALQVAGAPLAQTHIVSYAPLAAAVARSGPLDEPLVPQAPLVVGDPGFAEAANPGLRRLEGAQVEARAVAAALRVPTSRVLLDDRAQEAEVIALMATADVVHLATHGFVDELSPFASSLVLAGNDQLTVADLVGRQLTTSLATLSGCDTGRGTATLGSDIVGLTRSLLRSGVRQAVVSLWPVDDRVAPLVMDGFYRHIAAGHAPAEALALSQRHLRTMTSEALDTAYVALGGTPQSNDPGWSRKRRRVPPDLLLDPELRDDEPMPEPLDGSAERHWAAFVLVGT
jgi:CHAT domain-containing protein